MPHATRFGSRLCLAIAACLGLAASQSPAQQSVQAFNFIGGQVSSNTDSLSCPSGYRVSGIKVEYETEGAELFTGIKARCHRYGDDGGWDSSASWTEWSEHEESFWLQANTRAGRAYCPEDTWVAVLRGNVNSIGGAFGTTNTYVHRLRVYCYEGTQSGTSHGKNVYSKVFGGSGVEDVGFSKCPNYSLADGLRFNADELFLTQLRLLCRGLERPKIAYPESHALESTTFGFEFEPPFAATNITPHFYRLEACFAGTCEGEMLALDALDSDGDHYLYTVEREPGTWTHDVWACDEYAHCGREDPVRHTVHVVPDAPTLRDPENGHENEGHYLTFSWDYHPDATAGYMLFVYNVHAPDSDIYQPEDPEGPVNDNLFTLAVSSQTDTSAYVQVPGSLGEELRWAVAGCRFYDGMGRRCSLEFQPRVLTIAD